MMICIITYSLSLMIAAALTTTADVVYIGNNKYQCETHVVFGIVESQVLLDLIANSLCCYLFVKPLKYMLKLEQEIDPKPDDKQCEDRQEMYKVIRKSVILTFV